MTKRKYDFGSLRKREEGQSMVEFALVAPVLLIVLTGIFACGIAINQYEILTNAVSDGARAFALSRGNTAVTDPCAYAVSAVELSGATLTASNLSFTITYTPVGGSATSYSTSGSTPPSCSTQALATGDTVEVQASYPITSSIFKMATKTLNLTAATTELVQ